MQVAALINTRFRASSRFSDEDSYFGHWKTLSNPNFLL